MRKQKMSEPYRLGKTKIDDKWDSFVQSSPNGTIFSLSTYLNSLEENHNVYYCFKNNEIRAGVALMENNERTSAVVHDFVIYNGVMFTQKAKAQNRYQVHSEHFKILTFLGEELSCLYQNVSFSLDPSIIDIRPLLWFNYGSNLPKYEPDIRYTSYVDITALKKTRKPEGVLLFHELSSSRRQEIRYGIKKGVVTREEFQPDLFVDLYRRTISRQDKDVPEIRLQRMKRLVTDLFQANLGKMFVSYTAKGDLGSMAFWGIDRKRAYFIFGANYPKFRNEHTGSMILWDSFFALGQEGVTEIDMEGVNSPHRGWFKLSFGGDIRPYYHIHKIENKDAESEVLLDI